MPVQTRLTSLRRKLAEQELDLLLVTQPENRRYLSGFAERDVSFASSAGWLLIGQSSGYFLTGFLYYDWALQSVKDLDVVKTPPRFVDGLVSLLEQRPASRVGFESSWLSVAQHQELVGRLQGRHELVPTTDLVESLRQIKEPEEIAAIAAAIELTDRAYEHVLGLLRPGISERQVAWDLEKYLREHGAEGMAFEPAVAAGPNSAVPHHSPTGRPLEKAEPIWIDFGARLDGYCGDLTRSFCLGRADARFEEIYRIVLASQAVAEEGLRAGLTGVQGDALARDVIAAAGYGEAFGHSLGHGIGLAVHEGPRVSRAGTERLLPGMVTSVEPGIYIPGWGGVRIEDVAVVEERGIRVLTHAPKQSVVD